MFSPFHTFVCVLLFSMSGITGCSGEEGSFAGNVATEAEPALGEASGSESESSEGDSSGSESSESDSSGSESSGGNSMGPHDSQVEGILKGLWAVQNSRDAFFELTASGVAYLHQCGPDRNFRSADLSVNFDSEGIGILRLDGSRTSLNLLESGEGYRVLAERDNPATLLRLDAVEKVPNTCTSDALAATAVYPTYDTEGKLAMLDADLTYYIDEITGKVNFAIYVIDNEGQVLASSSDYVSINTDGKGMLSLSLNSIESTELQAKYIRAEAFDRAGKLYLSDTVPVL